MSNKRRTSYSIGLWAERLAALYFRLKGYRILAQRYKTKQGEVDLIAVRGQSLAIIEVKARAREEDALSAVGFRSRRRIEKAAMYFISLNPEYADYDIRFDIVVTGWPFYFRHLDNAWLSGA